MSDVALVLEDIVAYVRRYVVLTADQADAIALWVFHTYLADIAESTGYLSITSVLPRSGKTRMLEVLELLVHQPLPTANISDAALFRSIAQLHPTLLFDEIDSVFGPKARDREDFRGMLNAGYRRGAVARRMGGANKTTLEAFEVYCCKAFAGIGELPATIKDRTIRIRLERRIRDEEPIQRFRRRDADETAERIRVSSRSLADHYAAQLANARPELPDEIDDRAQDVWECLFAIADLAGGTWPTRARTAAITLSSDAEREDDSHSVLLLRDVHTVFTSNGTERYKTADLIAELSLIEESPWGDWYGKPISPQGLGKLLKPYRIRTMPVWVDGQTYKGYKAEQFAEAWLRVLGVRGVRGVRSGSSIDAAPNPPNPPNPLHTNSTDESAEMVAREWLARDGVWRLFEEEPPGFPGEVIETRDANRDSR